jgi:PAS domain S-box-containing protein
VTPASLDEALLRGTLDSSPDAILLVGAGGAIVFANARVESMLGYDPGDLVGELVERLVPEASRAAHVAHREAYAGVASTRDMLPGSLDTLAALRADGTIVPVDISLAPFVGEHQNYVVVAIRDATPRIERAEERQRLMQERDEALSTAKALGDLIPMCAWCKSIRTDSGYWTQVEKFIAESSLADVAFTHSICPECLDAQEDED